MQQYHCRAGAGEEQAKTEDDGEREKFLTFRLAKENYGIEILKVREIIGVIRITRVPRTPAYISGVINLRGKVLPVMDLRKRFGMGETLISEQACIVVVDPSGEGSHMMGMLVDSVSEVSDIALKDIEAVHDLGEEVQTEFIRGIGKDKQKVVLLLDIEAILDLAQVEESQDK